MRLQNAPLLQMLSLLGTTTAVQFRYGAPPDALVTTSLNDAPLLPTLQNLLHANGLDLQRDGASLFLFHQADEFAAPPAARSSAASGALKNVRLNAADIVEASTWHYWTRSTPPPARWMTSPGLAMKNGIRIGTRDELEAAKADVGAAWWPARFTVDEKRRPGIAVLAQNTFPVAAGASEIFLRWPFVLQTVPRGAQLLLEAPGEATLYVNGAPLLRRWSGARLIDLSDVLQPGHNCLAIRCRVAPDGAPDAAAKSSPAPLLRYEWFFAAGAR